MNPLPVNAAIKVEWQESACSFTATVQSVNPDGTYDVVYDEKVDGKTCIEKSVTKERIEQQQIPTVVSDYWMDDEAIQEAPSTVSPARAKKPKQPAEETAMESDEEDLQAFHSAPERSKLISKLLSVRVVSSNSEGSGTMETEQSSTDSAELASLSNRDVVTLHDLLTPQKVMELLSQNSHTDQVNHLVSLLVANLNHNCSEDTASCSFTELWSDFTADSNAKQPHLAWVHQLSAAEDSALSSLLAIHASTAALLRLQAGHAQSQGEDQKRSLFRSLGSAQASLSIPEESLERALRTANAFLNVNFLGSSLSQSSKSVNMTSGKASKAKNKDNFQLKAMAELAKAVLPTLASLLSSLEGALASSKQSERLCSTAAELAFTALCCDPSSSPALELLQVQSSTVLGSLHKCASSLLREAFASYASQRKTLLVELLSQLAQSFAVKTPYKSFALQHGAYQDGTRYTSVTFITLLSCLQSVVDVKECLTEDKSTARTSPPPDADGASSSSKGKVKKGAKKTEEPAAAFTDEYTKKDDRAGSVEEARKSVLQNYVCCATFVAELFQRCLHKEVSGDYRNLAGCLIAELLCVLQLPAWPIAAILLEQMMVHVLKQLSAETEQSTKRDAAYTTFLLDLLGAACVGMRSIIVTVEREQNATVSFRMNIAVQDSLEKKLARMKPSWLAAAKVVAESLTAPTAKKVSKSKGKTASDELHLDTLQSPVALGKLDVAAALDALQEVTSSVIDVMAELPRYTEDHTTASALPSPLEILRQVTDHAGLVSLFPDLSPLDLQYHHVSAHLARACAAGGASVGGGNALRDAYAACIALWYINAVSEDHRDVAAHVHSLLQAFAAQEKDQFARPDLGGKSPFKSPTSSAQRGFHEMDNASRGNYSIEAILAANRVILTARSLNSMFEHVLDAILALSVESVPAIRSKVIKVLSPLLQADNDLIQRDNIRFAITNRLLDRNISVREESVKLLGFYVVKGYERLAQPYLEGLKERLHDEGISVRKSVVLLFKEILLNQPNHPQYTELCMSLLEKASHPKEEESIKEIIRATFQQIWFLPPSASAVQTNLRLKLASQSSLQSLQSAQSSGLSGEHSCNSLTQQFGGILSASIQDAVTPRTPSESLLRVDSPVLSRASSFQLDGVILDNTVSPLAQAGAQGFSAAMSSPTESLTIDTRTDGVRSESSAQVPAVSTGRHTPSHRPATDAPNSAFSVASANSARSSLRGGLNSPKEALKDHIRSTALQLVEMAALDEANDWMISLLREMLHGTSEGDEVAAQLRQRRASSFKYCEQIVTCLVELLLCTEERQPEVMQLLQARNRDPQVQSMNIIRTIAMFCNAHPPFIAKHLMTLLPYLKHDNSYTKEQNALIKLKVTEIISSTALLDSSAFSIDVTEVVADLKKCALNQSGKNIKAAINCLALLAANVTRDASPLYQLADVCFKGIRSVSTSCADNSLLTPGHIGNLQRCLIVLGYVCECVKKCSAEMTTLAQKFHTTPVMANASSAVRKMYASAQANQSIAMKDIAEVEFLHPATLHGACYAAAIYALTVPNAAVQIRGAQALCGVFAGCPRLMMLAQEEGLLSALLGENYDDQVHERFIVALKDMMNVEEERLESQQALRQMKDSGVAVLEKQVVMGNLEQDSEATIPGFTLQQHFPELVGFLAHRSPSLRYATLMLVGTLLRQGMVCSLDVLASLIALQGDSDAKIRDEALTMLQTEDERHPTFMGNRMVDGVEQCYAFQLKALGNTILVEEKNTVSDPRDAQKSSVFGAFFSSCIVQPKRRKEFLDGLLSRSYQLITKLREQLAQHPSSFDAVLQLQAQQQKLLREEQLREEQLASAMLTDDPSAVSVATDAVSIPSKLTRKPSFPATTSSTAAAMAKGDFSLHVQNVKETFTRSGASDFIASTLAYLPYDAIEEPLQLIYFINRNVTVGASLLLHRLKQQVLVMGGELRKAGEMQPPVLGSKPRGAVRSGPTTPTTPSSGHAINGNAAAVAAAAALGPLEGDVDLLISEDAFHAWLHATLQDTSEGPTSGAALVVTRICEIIVIAQELRCNEAVLRLKSFIKLAYGITDDRCAPYNPEERSTAAASSNTIDKLAMANPHLSFQPHAAGTVLLSDILTAQQLTIFAANAVAFCKDSAAVSVLLGTLRQIAMDYNRITLLLNNDPEDFTLTVGSAAGLLGVGAKRKRKSVAAGATGAAGTGTAPKSTKPRGRPAKAANTGADAEAGKGGGAKKGKKKARKSSFALHSSDEGSENEAELDDDDDWAE